MRPIIEPACLEIREAPGDVTRVARVCRMSYARHMGWQSDLQIRMLIWTVALVVFPVVLVIYGLSGCDLRQRSEKHACKHGDAAQCVSVGKFYEAMGDGIIGFAMSNGATAHEYYYRACKLKSGPGCELMMSSMNEFDNARDPDVEITQVIDALIGTCDSGVDAACRQLDKAIDGWKDWVAVRSGNAFEKDCNAGNYPACYRLALLHENNLGGRENVLGQVLELHEKACRGGVADACKHADEYRQVKEKRAAKAASDAGVTGDAGASP